MTEPFQLTPVMPWPLSPAAAIVPDTCVPWPLSSIGSPSPLAKSYPWTSSTNPFPSSSMPLEGTSPGLVQTFAARSGWV